MTNEEKKRLEDSLKSLESSLRLHEQMLMDSEDKESIRRKIASMEANIDNLKKQLGYE